MYKLLDVIDLMGGSSIWAHTVKGKSKETLMEHSKLCIDYYDKYCKAKEIDKIVKKVIASCGCNDEETEAIYNMFVNAIYLHDIGKINPCFQSRKMNNPSYKGMDSLYDGNSNHALPSAYIYMCEYMPLIEGKSKRKFSFYLFAFAYCIARHHGYLKDAEGFKDDIMYCPTEGYYNKVLNLNKNSIITSDTPYSKIKKQVSDEIGFYILCKLLFSLITACDYCATMEYKNEAKLDINVIKNIDVLLSNYRNGNIYRGVMEYKKNKDYFKNNPINSLRSDIFIEAEESLKENPDTNIYYLEAPTGSGKTEISLNLMLNIMKENPKINNAFYVFPFNTLVEQTADTLEKYFKRYIDFTVVNSITPITIKKDKDSQEPDYEYSYLERIFNDYPIVVTSHVNFFNMLFGCGKEQIFPLIKLCNSVVVIDEIQSYKNSIWRHIIIFLNAYAKLLNIKIIVMSATLPKLDVLLNDRKATFTSLIKSPQKYYRNPIFKNRVEIDLSLLEYNKIDLDVLADKVIEFKEKKVLVEFISKVTARKFYNILKERSDSLEEDNPNIVELTGDDNAKYRKDMIQQIKDSKHIIVVSTQVIEAGVDIDMDIGFKDISTPDAEEQFLGRINRSCEKTNCRAYFFNYDNSSKIYKKDICINYPITNQEIAEMIKAKDFEGIYKKILIDIKDDTEKLNRNNIKYLFESCLTLKFKKIQKDMNLIEGSKQVFIAYEMETDEGEVIDGRQVWNQYKNLCLDKDISYAEKKVKLSILFVKMSYFTYTVYGAENMELRCDEELGGYYYINDGENFIEDGKFNREAFSKSMKGLFL